MKNSYLTLVLLVFSIGGYAQLECSNWFFGENVGLSFVNDTPYPNSYGALSTMEGAACISNSSGDLLFYTDGIRVWNKNHLQMQNGYGLLGDPSSSQSALIVQKPENDSLYYIFTVDDVAHGIGGSFGLNYSLVNLNLNSGNGDVVETEKNINLTEPMCEKITATKHANGVDKWILAQKWETNNIYAYLLTNEGVATEPIISSSGVVISGFIDNAKGYMKVSPDGSIIAKANAGLHSVEIFDFDNETGVVSNERLIPNIGGEPYGVEFSYDNTKLYVNTWKSNPGKYLYQYDLEAGTVDDFIASQYTVASGTEGAMQIGPDNKIYVAMNGQTSLSIINNPNEPGENCNFGYVIIGLASRTCRWGLPNFPSYMIPPVGQSELISASNEIKVFPNPSNGIFQIESKYLQGNCIIEVYNLNSKLIYKSAIKYNINSELTNIDLSFLEASTYIIRLITDNNSISTKVLIQ